VGDIYVICFKVKAGKKPGEGKLRRENKDDRQGQWRTDGEIWRYEGMKTGQRK
jgi:hypothetical protein